MKRVWHLRWWWLMVLMVCSSHAAWAQPSASSGVPVFAHVVRVQGDVKAWSGSNQPRALTVGTDVYVGEKIQADANGHAVFKTKDAGWVAVRPSSEWVIERFRHLQDADDEQVVALLKGGLRLITGQVGRLQPQRQLVKTQTATIGIRGTDHEVYVLPKKTSDHPAGTYDRVRTGGTSLSSVAGSLALSAGQVGVVSDQRSTRAMMSLLMPRILARVPDFFVPGVFDAELDAWVDAASPATCDPTAVAQQWLTQLDEAMHRRDAAAVVALFSPHARWQVSVLRRNGQRHALEMEYKEFVESTWVAMSGLTNFQQQRRDIHAQAQTDAAASPTSPCPRVTVRSQVVEQGQQGQTGSAYRLESEERYVLEQQQGRWLAIESITEQR